MKTYISLPQWAFRIESAGNHGSRTHLVATTECWELTQETPNEMVRALAFFKSTGLLQCNRADRSEICQLEGKSYRYQYLCVSVCWCGGHCLRTLAWRDG